MCVFKGTGRFKNPIDIVVDGNAVPASNLHIGQFSQCQIESKLSWMKWSTKAQ
jgi:hypothetical protein